MTFEDTPENFLYQQYLESIVDEIIQELDQLGRVLSN